MQHVETLTDAVESWRQELHDPDHGNRGSRARLKRCDSILDALLEPETHRLIARVHERATSYIPERKLPILALVLARVEHTANSPTFAKALGFTWENTIPTSDTRPRLSPMRFSALLRAGADADMDDFARALRRALAILGDTRFNVRRFIRDMLFFNDQTRRTWTFEYYHTRQNDTL